MGVPHDAQGSALYAFVTLMPGAEAQDDCGAIVAAADAVAAARRGLLGGVPHDAQGSAVYAFVTLTRGAETGRRLRRRQRGVAPRLLGDGEGARSFWVIRLALERGALQARAHHLVPARAAAAAARGSGVYTPV